jgi:hypothetical protein
VDLALGRVVEDVELDGAALELAHGSIVARYRYAISAYGTGGQGTGSPFASRQGSFTFAAPNGSVVTGTYLVEELANGLGSQSDCFVKGTLVQG